MRLLELWRSVQAQVAHLPRAWRLVAAASGRLLPAWFGLLLLAGLLPAATVHLTRVIVDLVASAQWSSLLPPAAALAVVLVLSESSSALRRWLGGLQAEKVGDELAERIQERAVSVGLEHYDDAAFYDRLHRARFHAQEHPSALLESGGSLLQNGLTLLAMAAVLLPFGWLWPALLVASALPGVVVALAVRLDDYEWRRRTTPRRRRAIYLDQLMSSREAAGEMRALDLGPHLRADYREVRSKLRDERRRLEARRMALELAAAAAALLVAAGALWWAAARIRAGLATLGELALIAQAFYQGQKMMRALLENAGDLYGHLFDLGDFFAFLDLDGLDPGRPAPAVASTGGPGSGAPSIVLRGVSFRYRAGTSPALDGLELDIEPARLHAVIGPNGAGKTTLLKLLAGLLEPQDGEILVDGDSLPGLDRREWRRRVAVMFQEPVRYQTTLLENVRFGDLDRDPPLADLERAAGEAGLETLIASLEEGWQTRLGAWFHGGRELSAGQWQRLALARSCLRRAPLWLLDEPTSAVDPWTERTFFERLRPLVEHRTVLLVTHRPSAARHADRIHVLDAGRLVESGTPAELLESGGRYASMWRGAARAGDT